MLVGIPGEHPLGRDDVQAVRLLHVPERPRTLQPTIIIVHRLPPNGRILARIRFSIRVRC